ncbi:amino acid carrier protein [Clostridium sp. CAG:1024]|nr:amino acid carrier protein [Clostridium sp. CAG:1024]
MQTLCATILLLAAVTFSFRTRFVQFRRLGRALVLPLRGNTDSSDGVSPFEAASTSLAATIGTGNIAGVAGALLLGGPGALLWLWVSALLGMGLKYAEIVIAMRYRRRGNDGVWRGGPMYCISYGLPKRYSILAILFSLCGMLVALGMGNLVQVNTVAESAEALYTVLSGRTGPQSLLYVRLTAGILAAVLLALVLSGGALRVGRAASLLVPVMSLLYLVFCFVILLARAPALPGVFRLILESAFSPRAALGGTAGIGFLTTFRVGLSRGVFSHEAGLGTSAIAHSGAEGISPQDQGLFGVFEVFFDALLCTLTGLTVLVSGITMPYGDASLNSTLVINAFSTRFSPALAAVFIAVSLLLFAFTSMTTFALYGARCAEFLFGSHVQKIYYVVFLLVTILGALLPRSAAWEIGELLNAAMSIPNLTAMALLVRRVPQLKDALQK